MKIVPRHALLASTSLPITRRGLPIDLADFPQKVPARLSLGLKMGGLDRET